MKRTRWKLAGRILLFNLPLAIFFGVPALVLWLGGEFANPDAILARQAKGEHTVLYGLAYSDCSQYIKMRLLARRRPDVLALGNSRVMQFRREFFRPEVTFFNAGGTVMRIQDFRAFLERLPVEALPRTVIIDTEASFFLPSSDRLRDTDPMIALLQRRMDSYSQPLEVYRSALWKVWNDLVAGKIPFARLASGEGFTTRIGLQALCREQGFREDGSVRYGRLDSEIENRLHRDYRFASTLRMVRAGEARFSWSDTFSERAVRECDLLLDFCHAHGIALIGFMPPHAHPVWEAMQALGDKYEYMRKVEHLLRERFAARGFEFYDFSDFAAVGAPDSEAIDGYHGSERFHVRLMIAMLEQGSRLNAVADLPRLREILASTHATTGLELRDPAAAKPHSR